jgi:hypothetical protein
MMGALLQKLGFSPRQVALLAKVFKISLGGKGDGVKYCTIG